MKTIFVAMESGEMYEEYRTGAITMSDRTEFIDRQAAMNAFAERVKRSNNSDFAPVPRWNDAVEIVENLPSADAIEVVRCKDCKHYDLFNNGCNGMCLRHIDAFEVFYPDDFCSYGERK